jgi:transmembrane sensor
MSTEYYYHLIFKKLNKGLDPDEAQSLETWLSDSEENRRAAAEIQFLLDADKVVIPPVDVSQELASLKTRLKKEEPLEDTPALETTMMPRLSYVRKWWLAAASVALLAIALVFFSKDKMSTTEWVSIASADQGSQPVLLPDGSQVWLHQNTILSFEKGFAASDFRRLRLQGEAYFEVQKNAEKPFIVEAAACRILVLGTSFDIRSRDREDETFVAVKTGKVRVSSTQAQLELNPGEKAIVSRSSGKLQLFKEDVAHVAHWRSPELEYRNLALGHVLQQLSHRFEVKIQIGNPDLVNCPYSIYLPKADLPSVMANLEAVFGVSIAQTADGYRLEGGKCPE